MPSKVRSGGPVMVVDDGYEGSQQGLAPLPEGRRAGDVSANRRSRPLNEAGDLEDAQGRKYRRFQPARPSKVLSTTADSTSHIQAGVKRTKGTRDLRDIWKKSGETVELPGHSDPSERQDYIANSTSAECEANREAISGSSHKSAQSDYDSIQHVGRFSWQGYFSYIEDGMKTGRQSTDRTLGTYLKRYHNVVDTDKLYIPTLSGSDQDITKAASVKSLEATTIDSSCQSGSVASKLGATAISLSADQQSMPGTVASRHRTLRRVKAFR